MKSQMYGWIAAILLGCMASANAEIPAVMNPRYVILGDTVLDKKTNLTWARCSVGQQWKEGAGCTGTVKTFTFGEAQQLSAGSWRVPTKEELETLIVAGNTNPAMDKLAFPNMDMQNLGYWTSTPDGDLYGWMIFFFDGRVDNINQIAFKSVRLLRNKP